MTKTATAEKQPHAVVELIPLDKIAESPTNPRRTFSGIEELAESVKEHGVLQPILVRPIQGIGSNLFQVVFGARRFRAAKTAGLKAVPAMVRDLSDVEALEQQIVENLNRPDVHPLEEAEGFQALLQSKERSYTIATIAAKVKKSESYVYSSLKLLDLCKEGRDAFYAGSFTKASALLVARVQSQEVQREILKGLDRRGGDDEAWSLHEVSYQVKQRMCRLAEAPFRKDDADLVPGAGPCSTCPRRSGAQPELFSDVSKQEGELCTDPPCFEKKKDAAWARDVEAAKAKGLKVLDGKAAEKAMAYGGEFVKLTDTCHRDPKYRSWKQLIGKAAKDQVVLARDERGDVHELVPKKETNKLLKAAGHDFKADRQDAGPGRAPAESAKEREDRAVEQEVQRRVLAQFGDALDHLEPDREVWDRLLAVALDQTYGDEKDTLSRRFSPLDPDLALKAFDKARPKMEAKQLRALALELLLMSDVSAHRSPGAPPLLKWAGINVKEIAVKVKTDRKAAAAEKARQQTTSAPARQRGGKPTPKARAAATEAVGEACLDCGVPSGDPSPGCDECDHGRSKPAASVADQVAAAVDHLGIESEKAPKKTPKGKGAARG